MANTTASAPSTEEQPWHAAFPSPKSVATPVSREQMREWLTGDKVPGKDFVLVDLRRNDYKVRSLDSYHEDEWCIVRGGDSTGQS